MSNIDFIALRTDLRPHQGQIVKELLPNGRREGNEWVALNPTRLDRHPGSFRFNLNTGQWADFATGCKGGDVISLFAYDKGCRQSEAARRLMHRYVGGTR